MKRLFALLVLAAMAAGLWYWKLRPGAGPSLDALGSVGQGLRDAALVGGVKTALSLNRSLKPYSIEVTAEDGVVTLRGVVGSEEAKATAERVAEAVPDVRQLVSHLRVAKAATPREAKGRSLGESLDDHALAVQVRLAFSLHKDLKGADIAVQAFRREITLTGDVASEAQRTLAEQIARDTADVLDVKNALRVEPEPEFSPRRPRGAASKTPSK
jgi:osmotically-inducible protein OsmY